VHVANSMPHYCQIRDEPDKIQVRLIDYSLNIDYKTAFLALSTVVQLLVAGSPKSYADLTKSTSRVRLEERLPHRRPFDMLLLPVKGS